ncbi:S41 family peptidase [Maribacter aestuarii]|uniref:S41 family peptidase n=1 Tax=Maribacter aestuarii TaxID=1130723 RepID=UPI00248BFC9D|nr:S41 family peptidase [Maribacter aestuarii]
MKNYFLLLLCIGICFSACNSDDDTPIVEEEQQEEQEEQTPEEVNIVVQNFMWQTMNAYYFWQGDVPDLADDRFATQTAYEDFLAATPNPNTFIQDKLVFSGDRFTAWSDDYKDFTNRIAGISKSNGLEFGLSLIGQSEDIFGFVEYIVKDSDASSKDIKRGDIFIGVNGTRLNRSNYIDLLFGDADTYTLDMATIENNTITPNGKEVTLTKQEGLVEDPILVDDVLTFGDKRIGYLMYNLFSLDSGDALNQVFAEFKNQNITDLVLDLRYNPGGRVTTATILASLIHGPNTDQLFLGLLIIRKLKHNLSQANWITILLVPRVPQMVA